jgi:hypothetical protein
MRTTFLACLAAVLLLSACSSPNTNQPPTPKEQAPKAERTAPVQETQYATGREAFQRMYVSARGWAGDVQPFRLQSQYTPDAPASQGKAAVWQASFGSPARKAMKMFTWSGLSGGSGPERGVTFSAEDSWSPSNSSTHIFQLDYIKNDSDQAFSVAQKHGGEKIMQKDPKQPVFFTLDWDAGKNALLWHVIYGSSRDDAKLQVAVDATSGKFESAEK